MRRVTNCILLEDNRVLLIRKPSRGWYSIPGGKMERGETISEAVIREYWEETALKLNDPKLAGVFSFIELGKEDKELEWMMFTFISHSYQGILNEESEEGKLEWVKLDDIPNLPMAEGDYEIFNHILNAKNVIDGAFIYTTDRDLLTTRMDPNAN